MTDGDGTETFEQGDDAVDEEARLDPGFEEARELDPSLDPNLQADEREREEAGAELDDPEQIAVLDGMIDDPDGLGGPSPSPGSVRRTPRAGTSTHRSSPATPRTATRTERGIPTSDRRPGPGYHPGRARRFGRARDPGGARRPGCSQERAAGEAEGERGARDRTAERRGPHP